MEGLGRAVSDPLVLNVFKLPHRLEAALTGGESVVLIEPAGSYVLGERVQIQHACRLLLGQPEQGGPDALAEIANTHVKLSDIRSVCGHKAKDLIVSLDHLNARIGSHLVYKISELLLNGVLILDSDSKLKTLPPHANEFICVFGIEVREAVRLHEIGFVRPNV